MKQKVSLVFVDEDKAKFFVEDLEKNLTLGFITNEGDDIEAEIESVRIEPVI